LAHCLVSVPTVTRSLLFIEINKLHRLSPEHT